ncbi:MAG: hypothetical protein VYD57_13495 [Pseudomonadota bacterium]|nr:hypothetical protein [Pseudomonadota bacterium]
MAIRYDKYDRLASRAVDKLYGEPSTILPMTAAPANGRAARDPDREPHESKGVFDRKAADANVQFGSRGPGRGNDLNTTTNGVRMTFSVDRAELVDEAGSEVPIRVGDVIELTDRPGSPKYRIARVLPGNSVRVDLELEVFHAG